MVPCPNHMRYGYRESLGGQALDLPAVLPVAVDETIMHTALSPLPELDHLGAQQVAAPVLGPLRIRLAQLGHELDEAAIELLTLDRLALGRDRGGDLAVARPAREVGVGFLRREALPRSPDPHLSIELAPGQD